MTQRAGIWVGGVLASSVAHLGVAALLLWAVDPDSVDQQPNPQSELQLQAYHVPSSQAAPLEPNSDPATQSDSQGQGLAAGQVPQSTAKSLASHGDQVTQSAPDSTPITAAQDPSEQIEPLAAEPITLAPAQASVADVQATAAPVTSLTQAVVQTAALIAVATPSFAPIVVADIPVLQATTPLRPTPVVLATVTSRPDTLLTVAPASTPGRQQAPEATDLAPAVATLAPATSLTLTSPALENARPQSTPSQQHTPNAPRLTEHPPAPIAAALSAPDVPHIKAALAFSGDDAGQADPLSLAAFQSFMMPGDIAAQGDPLRDGVAGVLAAVPCSRLQVVFDPETATLNLRGHLPDTGLRAPVLAALQAQMGADIQVSDQMKILPRPQCGALAGISNVGLPQSTDQITNPRLIGADTHARVLDYTGGDRLFFDLTAPDYDAYVYVDYFDADGAVLHLSPNEAVPLVQTPAQSRLRVGAKTPEDSGLQITVAPPYGQEIAVAFAASHPLYPGFRPIIEEASEYLIWLTERVAEARAIHPDFKGEWVYFFVSTAAP